MPAKIASHHRYHPRMSRDRGAGEGALVPCRGDGDDAALGGVVQRRTEQPLAGGGATHQRGADIDHISPGLDDVHDRPMRSIPEVALTDPSRDVASSAKIGRME